MEESKIKSRTGECNKLKKKLIFDINLGLRLFPIWETFRWFFKLEYNKFFGGCAGTEDFPENDYKYRQIHSQ